MRALLLFVAILVAAHGSAPGADFTVDTTVEGSDAIPGDGLCATLLSQCTLRAAIEEANALPGTDGVHVPGGLYSTLAPLEIFDTVTVDGSGSALPVIIDAGGTHTAIVNDSASAAFYGLTIRNGHSSNAGGGIVNGGTMSIIGCTVSGNTVNNAAAGIENLGSLEMFESTVSGNTAGNAVAGIENDGTLVMQNCTVSGNSVGNACAGIQNTGGGILTNVTVSGNHAGNSGGGICNQDGGVLDLVNVTVTANTGGIGGVTNEGATMTIKNSIVSGNGNDIFNDADGTISMLGHSLAQTTIGTLMGPGSVIVGPPNLGPLQINGTYLGYATRTHAPLASSLAIDAATDGCPVFDQRYAPRPQGTACDIGAVEGNNPVCTSQPRTDCRQPISPKRSTIKLRSARLTWRWSKGAATALADFGDPLTTTDYRLCIYDRPGGPFPRLLRSPSIPAGGTCGSRPCWKSVGAKGFKYHDTTATPNGIVSVQLRPGPDGKAAVNVTGKGNVLGSVLPLPIKPQVTVQLLASNGQCWDAEYIAFITSNNLIEFKAKNGSPSGAFLE